MFWKYTLRRQRIAITIGKTSVSSSIKTSVYSSIIFKNRLNLIFFSTLFFDGKQLLTIPKLFPNVTFLHGNLELLKNKIFILLKINISWQKFKVFLCIHAIVLTNKRCSLISSFPILLYVPSTALRRFILNYKRKPQ